MASCCGQYRPPALLASRVERWIHRSGWEAWLARQPLETCPYRGRQPRLLWLQGWIDAHLAVQSWQTAINWLDQVMSYRWTQYHQQGANACRAGADLWEGNPYSHDPHRDEVLQSIFWADGWLAARCDRAPNPAEAQCCEGIK